MNKTELVAAVAEKAGISKSDAEKALNAFTSVVTKELKNGERIQLVGFGTFETAKRKAREGKNPQTGEKISIPSSLLPKFKPGKSLKDAVNGKAYSLFLHNPLIPPLGEGSGPLAQSVERRPHKLLVVGSSPSRSMQILLPPQCNII